MNSRIRDRRIDALQRTKALKMPVRIAKLSPDGKQPLVVMTNSVVVRHAHSPMELHRLLANEFSSAIRRYFRCRDQLRRVAGLRIESLGRRADHRSRLNLRDSHVGQSMLKRLERAQGMTELVPRFQVVHRQPVAYAHGARSFRAYA